MITYFIFIILNEDKNVWHEDFNILSVIMLRIAYLDSN